MSRNDIEGSSERAPTKRSRGRRSESMRENPSLPYDISLPAHHVAELRDAGLGVDQIVHEVIAVVAAGEVDVPVKTKSVRLAARHVDPDQVAVMEEIAERTGQPQNRIVELAAEALVARTRRSGRTQKAKKATE